MTYIRNHWQGEHSLVQAFWINLIALRIIILFLERFTHPPFTGQTTTAMVATSVYFLVFNVIVYWWQVRGVLKACDKHSASMGSFITVILIQTGIVISLFFTVVYVLAAFQALFSNPDEMYKNRFKQQGTFLAPYTLALSDDGTRIHMSGDFRIGVTKDLRNLLQKHPSVLGVVFNSDGGRVSEGRGVAKLMKENGLEAFVFGICKSACVTAFTGGKLRTLGPNGKLGFHQFSMKSLQKTPYIDPLKEQEKDMEFFASQGVDVAFLKKVYETSPSDIWLPGADELIAAGLVHRVLINE